jgi:transposase-like protein
LSLCKEYKNMARVAKSSASPEPRTRKRLTAEQRAGIAQALARGEAGNAVAARFGVSTATVYAQKRKTGAVGIETPRQQENPLRVKLVNFAVRLLLGQEVSAEERGDLERQVRDEFVKRVAAGI